MTDGGTDLCSFTLGRQDTHLDIISTLRFPTGVVATVVFKLGGKK